MSRHELARVPFPHVPFSVLGVLLKESTVMIRTFTSRHTVFVGVALLGALTLSACGSTSNSTTSSKPTGGSASTSGNTAHNSADVTFSTDMIPHHAQAVEMADMALAQATNADIKTLATAIKGAQAPEIATMSAWLKGWGKPIPASGHSMSGMHGSGSTGMGMMSDGEMTALGKATAAEFDRMWVDMMTRHHRGAIEMAGIELKDGQDAASQALATMIIATQTTEVATMTALAKSP